MIVLTGKSTMMDILAGRKSSNGLKGKVLFNGHHSNAAITSKYLSYIGQVKSWSMANILKLTVTVADSLW